MRRRRWIWLLIAVVVVLLLVGGVAGNMAAQYQGWTIPRQSPEDVASELRPSMRLVLPETGAAPFPAALLFSGCDGPRDSLDTWAAALAGVGIASLIVDSHGPRGLDDAALWRLVCTAQLLTGPERAGDVAVAIAEARARPEIDGERLALVGASHGGWSVLDLLALRGEGRLPHGMTGWPDGFEATGPPPGVRAAVLLYPYCGPGSRVARWGWPFDIPVLFLLVEGDTIVNERDCLAVAGRAEAGGLPVRVEMFEGVTHGFDQQERAALSALRFDPAATERAMGLMTEFLQAELR